MSEPLIWESFWISKLNPKFPPRQAKSTFFVILLCLTPDDFTHWRRATELERIKPSLNPNISPAIFLCFDVFPHITSAFSRTCIIHFYLFISIHSYHIYNHSYHIYNHLYRNIGHTCTTSRLQLQFLYIKLTIQHGRSNCNIYIINNSQRKDERNQCFDGGCIYIMWYTILLIYIHKDFRWIIWMLLRYNTAAHVVNSTNMYMHYIIQYNIVL